MEVVLRFGLFELDAGSGELRRSGIPVKLRLQPAKVLALLASEPGRLFTREEIQVAVWGPGTHVDFEQGLNYCIKEIRAALGDRAEAPTYVETLARRGYRFIAPVETMRPAAVRASVPAIADAPAAPEPPPARRRGWAWRPAAAASIVLALTSGLLLARARPSGRIVVAVLPFENKTGLPDYELFSDGLTEEMQLQLGHLQPAQLTVIARTTARGYASRPRPIAALADDLDVDYVLEGMVRRCARHSRLSVTARLVRASSRRELWSTRLQEPIDEAVDLQRSLAHVLAASVGTALAQREPARLQLPVRSADTRAP